MIGTETKQSKRIILPNSYPLTLDRLENLNQANQDLRIAKVLDNTIEITESNFSFQEQGVICIKLPDFNYTMFEEMHELNVETKLEFANREVWIKMGIFGLIGILTAAILSSLYLWSRHQKSGQVYADPTEYELDDPENPEKKIRRIPDVSYISYQSHSKEEQASWADSYIPKPPNLAIEIVSAKYGLKLDLKKMEDVWMKTGVDVGIVICPFSETIYIFEKGIIGHTMQSIYQDFTHSLLPNYRDNFGEYVKEYRK